MLRSDSVLVFASWIVVVGLILGAVLLTRALRRRDQRQAHVETAYLPVEIFGKQVPLSDLRLFRAYVPRADQPFVRRMLRLSDEAVFQRLGPDDVLRFQRMLEAAYGAWAACGCSRAAATCTRPCGCHSPCGPAQRC